MKNKEIMALIKKGIEVKKMKKKIEKMKYDMEFGDFSVQYDFSLN